MSCCKRFSADFFYKRGRENCLFAWYFCGGYTTARENGELRRNPGIIGDEASYTTTRENGELRQHGIWKSANHRYTTTRENGELRRFAMPWSATLGYTTTRKNGELRRKRRFRRCALIYTTTRENGEQRQCLCPKYSVMISPHIISAFSACVNPPNGEKRF